MPILPTLRDIQTAIMQGKTSAEAETSAALGRIETWNGQLKAFVSVDRERALAEARHLDHLAQLGVPKGPLHGVPVAIKDIIHVAGHPTGAGSLTRRAAMPELRDALIVTRLRAAGAVIIGKAATVEYAFGGWGSNETMGTPLNPWDMKNPRVPGGSSNGSSVAVAAGLVPGALGSDTGGSIRLPSSFSGLVGLKTTAGLIETIGVLPLSEMLDTLGPLTRTVDDAAALFAAMCGGQVQDVLRDDTPERLAAWYRGKRIGLVTDLGVELHRDTARVYAETRELLISLGAVIVPISLGRSLAAYAAPCGAFLAVDSYFHYGHFAEETPCRLGEPVRRRIMSARDISAAMHRGNHERREAEKKAIATLYEQVDAILMPSTAFPAPLMGEHPEHDSPAVFTRFANYLDLAAISLPMGLSGEGLPVGMQLVVPGFQEGRALRLAKGLESARGGPILCPLTSQMV
jgi:aspartyl-tRNA(Asn)/glutamyl-tRNA(Gln) amidotransferase subunit A